MYTDEDLEDLGIEIIEFYDENLSLSVNELQDKMGYFYRSLKSMAPSFYINNEMKQYPYDAVLRVLCTLERKHLPKYYILPLAHKYMEDDFILSRIIRETYKRFIRQMGFDDSLFSIDCFDLTNECKRISIIVSFLCNKMGIPNRIITIDFAFDNKIKLLNGNGFHCANMVTIHGEDYLIDASYKQFFLMKTNNIERIGIPHLVGCNPGFFMVQEEKRKETALDLLNTGYIKATPENLKNYFDGFAMSFRNGLYYENMNDFYFSTDYTVEDYFNFLDGSDSQINHEKVEFLGRQRRPLRNVK